MMSGMIVVCAVYLEDKEECLKVKMCDTYNVLTDRSKEVETLRNTPLTPSL